LIWPIAFQRPRSTHALATTESRSRPDQALPSRHSERRTAALPPVWSDCSRRAPRGLAQSRWWSACRTALPLREVHGPRRMQRWRDMFQLAPQDHNCPSQRDGCPEHRLQEASQPTWSSHGRDELTPPGHSPISGCSKGATHRARTTDAAVGRCGPSATTCLMRRRELADRSSPTQRVDQTQTRDARSGRGGSPPAPARRCRRPAPARPGGPRPGRA
jgi:hypothetical protein